MPLIKYFKSPARHRIHFGHRDVISEITSRSGWRRQVARCAGQQNIIVQTPNGVLPPRTLLYRARAPPPPPRCGRRVVQIELNVSGKGPSAHLIIRLHSRPSDRVTVRNGAKGYGKRSPNVHHSTDSKTIRFSSSMTRVVFDTIGTGPRLTNVIDYFAVTIENPVTPFVENKIFKFLNRKLKYYLYVCRTRARSLSKTSQYNRKKPIELEQNVVFFYGSFKFYVGKYVYYLRN